MTDIKHKDYDTVLTAVEAGLSPLMVGPAGCGKTTIAMQIADEFNLPFYYSGAVDSPYKLVGFRDANGHYNSTPFVKAYKDGGVFLLDEMDASDAQALVALNAALDNGLLDTPDGMIKKNANFHCIAAANTWGHGATMDYIGRNPLDGATLDRYVTVGMDYDQTMERNAVLAKFPEQGKWVTVVQQARKAARELQIRCIISPRASLQGAALLDQGKDAMDVFTMTVLKGMPKEDGDKILHEILDQANMLSKNLGAKLKMHFNGAANDNGAEEIPDPLRKPFDDTVQLLALLESIPKEAYATPSKKTDADLSAVKHRHWWRFHR